MHREIYCLRCPRGCLLQVEIQGENISVHGNHCRLGEEFATQEIHAPRRLFTSSIRVTGGRSPLVPVMTSQPILRQDIQRWRELCQSLSTEAPVAPRTVVAHNPFGDGIDLVTTWFVEEDICRSP